MNPHHTRRSIDSWSLPINKPKRLGDVQEMMSAALHGYREMFPGVKLAEHQVSVRVDTDGDTGDPWLYAEFEHTEVLD